MPAPSLPVDTLPQPLDEPLRWTGGAAPRLLPYGSALFPAMQQAIERADEALYRSKDSGRNSTSGELHFGQYAI